MTAQPPICPRPPTATLLIYAGAVFPFLVLLGLIAMFWLPFPYADEWVFVETLDAAAEEGIDLSALMAEHNGHRLFIPKLIYTWVVLATGWSHAWITGVNLAFGMLWCVLMVLAARSWINAAGKPVPWFVPFGMSALSFAGCNAGNYAWGWQMQIVLCCAALAAVHAALAHDRPGPVRLAWALVGAFAATFSFGAGVTAWPLGAAVLAYQGWRQRTARPLAIWLIAGGIAFFLYRYKAAPGSGASTIVQTHPLVLAGYTLAYIGSPLAQFRPWLAPYVGGAGIAAMAVLAGALWRNRRLRWAAFQAAALGGTVVLMGLLTGMGRGLPEWGGILNATQPRYTSLGLLFWQALIGLAAATAAQASESSIRRTIGAGLAAGLVLLALSNRQAYYTRDEFYKVHRPEVVRMLRNDLEVVPPRLKTPMHEPLSQELRILKERKWSVYRPGATAYWGLPDPAQNEASQPPST